MNPLFENMIGELLSVSRRLSATGEIALSLCGSHGKGLSDIGSDYDICLYCETLSEQAVLRSAYAEIDMLKKKWRERGIIIDGPLPRTYQEIDDQLELWLSGQGEAVPYVWTIWGYHLLTQIYHQTILHDPRGKVAAWRERLAVYPSTLRDAVIQKHSASLRYWRNDYHYQNKVKRGDIVFLSALSSRLIHDIMQILFALNRVYYPGDGANLDYARHFSRKPHSFEQRVTMVLSAAENQRDVQYDNLMVLIDDILAMLQAHGNH